MSGNPNISNADRRLYELTVEEAVEEVSKLPKGEVNQAEAIIQQFLDDVEMHVDSANKFRGEVLRKVADQKLQAEDDRERKILEKFEGQVVSADKQLRFAGVDTKQKFYVRGGSLLRRIFGKRYNAADVNDLLHDVQKLEDDIEQNQLQLDMLKASYEASRKSLQNARKIFKSKREGRFVVGYMDDAVTSWKAARGQKKRATQEYETSGKQQIKEINTKSKELNKQKDVLTELRKKVDARRKNGRDIFENQFGEQVQILRQMSGKQQKQEEKRLREDVRVFGQNLGVVYIEYFLNEALGVAPKTAGALVLDERGGARPEGIVYQEPLTEREAAQEMAVLSRWCEFVLGRAPSEGQLLPILAYLRDQEPRLLSQNLQTQQTKAITPAMYELRFLLTGKDLNGKELLDTSRCARQTPENIGRLLRYATEHQLSKNDLSALFERFAKDDEFQNYNAQDFDYILEFLKKAGQQPAPAPQPAQKKTNEKLPLSRAEEKFEHDFSLLEDPNLAKELYHAAIDQHPDRKEMINSKKNRQMMKMLMTGKFASISLQSPNFEHENKKDYIQDVLEILPFFNKTSIHGLLQDLAEFKRKNKKHTCREFLKFLRKTYKDFISYER